MTARARYVVRDRGGRGPNLALDVEAMRRATRFSVIDTATGETVRVSTARDGAQNQADALNTRHRRGQA